MGIDKEAEFQFWEFDSLLQRKTLASSTWRYSVDFDVMVNDFHLKFELYLDREKWEDMLKIVRCEIISMTRNDTIDAYVLR